MRSAAYGKTTISTQNNINWFVIHYYALHNWMEHIKFGKKKHLWILYFSQDQMRKLNRNANESN